MFDLTTAAAYHAAGTAVEKAQAVRDSLGSGTLTVQIVRDDPLFDIEPLVMFTGTFSGPMVAGEDGSLSKDVVLSGVVGNSGTPGKRWWTCRITNGSRYIEGSFGPGGRFTSRHGDLVVGQAMRLNVSIAAAGAGAVPAWRQGQAVNEWREIQGSAMSLCPPTVNPGRNSGKVSAKIQAWCGLSIDTRDSTVWAVANGGHDDYHGNEVNKIRLSADAPAWVEVYRSSSAAEFTIPNNAAYYSNGAPVSAHSYYSQQVIESRDMAIRFGVGSGSSVGNAWPVIDGFATTTPVGSNGWATPGTFPSYPIDFNWDIPVCKDPRTEDVYWFHLNYNVYKWTNATNTIAQHNVGFPPRSMGYSATAFDTERNCIFLVNGGGGYTYDLGTGKFTARTLTGSDVSVLTSLGEQAMVYEPDRGEFLYFRMMGVNDIRVYEIHPTTFEVTLLSSAALPADPGPSGGGNPFNRFLYAPKLKGCIWFGLYAANGWFLRTA